MAFMCIESVHAQASQIAMDLGKAILGKVGEKVIDEALTKMGYPSVNRQTLDAVNKLSDKMEDVNKSIDDLSKLVINIDLKNTLTLAKQDINIIISQKALLKSWSDNNRTNLTSKEIDDMFSAIDRAIKDLALHLNDPSVGLFTKLRDSKNIPDVSDLHDYWKKIEAYRRYFSQYLAIAVAIIDAESKIQQKSFNKCLTDNKITNVAQTNPGTADYKFVGEINTSCRSVWGTGAPSEPASQGNDNIFFTLTKYPSLEACQQACIDLKDACKSVEYNAKIQRCELWKQSTTAQPSSFGYTCKVKTLVNSGSTIQSTNSICDNIPKISAATLVYISQQAKDVYDSMYALGVPLMEDRGTAKFIHIKGEEWALSAPAAKGEITSGYYAPAIPSRIMTKLQKLKAKYVAVSGLSLEQYLSTNKIPTAFVSPDSWKCEAFTCRTPDISASVDYSYQEFAEGTVNRYGRDENKGFVLSANIAYVQGNNVIDFTPYVFSYKIESQASCEATLNYLKTRSLSTTGLTANTLTDDDLGKNSCLYQKNKYVSRGPLFGNFFTYDLTAKDAQRLYLLKYTINDWPIKYCGLRLNKEGRAALTNQAALNDFDGKY